MNAATEEKKVFENHYRHCGEHWSETGDSACNDRCPQCNKEIQPYESVDITHGVDTNPKVHILFFGAKVAQWGNCGDVPIAKTIDRLRETGSYLFYIGDKEMGVEENVREWARFSDLILGWEERGYTKDRWIIVLDTSTDGFRQVATHITGNPVAFIYNHIPPATNTFLNASDIRAHSNRPAALYNAIQKYLSRNFNNQQSKKEITMQTKPTMTNAGLHNLLVGARQLIALWMKESLFSAEHIAKERQSIFSAEHVAKELHNLRDHSEYAPSAMASPQVSTLVNDLIPAFSMEVELNKEEANGFIMRLDMVIDLLRTRGQNNDEYWPKTADSMPVDAQKVEAGEAIDFEELLIGVSDAAALLSGPAVSADPMVTVSRLKKVEAYLLHQRGTPFGMAISDNPPASNVEAILRQLSADFAEGHQILERSIAKLGEHFSEASGVMAKAIDNLMENVHKRLQTTEDRLSNEMKEDLQHMLGMLNQRPSAGQPFGPVPQSPLDSFPKMPDNFGFPNPFYNPDYPRGPIPPAPPLHPMQWRNGRPFPPAASMDWLKRDRTQSSFSGNNSSFRSPSSVPTTENFNGVFLFHLENDDAAKAFELVRGEVVELYPQAKIEVVNYEGADNNDALFGVYKKTMAVIAECYRGAAPTPLLQHILLLPSRKPAPHSPEQSNDLEKVTAIKNVLSKNGLNLAAITYDTMEDRDKLSMTLNAALTRLQVRAGLNSFSSPAAGGPLFTLENYYGIVMLHVNDGETDQVMSKNERVFRNVFPNAKFYIARHPEYGNKPTPLVLQDAMADATQQCQTDQVFHIVLDSRLIHTTSIFMTKVCHALTQANQPNMTVWFEGTNLSEEHLHYNVSRVLPLYGYVLAGRANPRF
jgi:hypothetical protein